LETAQADYATATAGTIPADLKRAQLDVTAAEKAFNNAKLINDNSQRLYQQGAIPRRALDQAGVDLTNAQNAYELAQQHLQATEKVGHAQALRAAQGNLDSAQGHAAAAAALLSYAQITSPIDGVVTDRPMYPGELATPAAPLMTVADLSRVVARAALPADQAALLKVGDAATLTAPGSDHPLPARVSVVSPATDPGSTTLEVWVEAENPGGVLRPGTSVQVAILARTLPQALTVPASAVLSEAGGETSVMVVGADHKAHQKTVELGVRDTGRVQILNGVAAGATVVSVGAYGLPDASPIKVEAPKPAEKDAD
jgi:RND family efflux transporter MFP subunit